MEKIDNINIFKVYYTYRNIMQEICIVYNLNAWRIIIIWYYEMSYIWNAYLYLTCVFIASQLCMFVPSFRHLWLSHELPLLMEKVHRTYLMRFPFEKNISFWEHTQTTHDNLTLLPLVVFVIFCSVRSRTQMSYNMVNCIVRRLSFFFFD